MNESMDNEWMNEWIMNEWMNVWMNEYNECIAFREVIVKTVECRRKRVIDRLIDWSSEWINWLSELS